MSLTAIFEETGPPAQVLQLRETALPQLQPDEVLLRMLAAPVNPADLNFIAGTYGIKPTLPATPGIEGAGEVIETGPAVKHIRKGDLVRSFASTGTWRQHLILKASDCLVLPPGLSDDQAAMIYVNPVTAWRMLHDFVSLQPGDWVAQNAGNSAVGRCVIQIAKALGFKTYSLVRRPELIGELKALGADVVETEEQFDRKTSGSHFAGTNPRLALNAVGGASALSLANLLARGGTHVTYGAMAKMPLKIPNGLLIFNDLAFRGFWLTAWGKNASLEEQGETLQHLGNLMKEGKLNIPVAQRYPLSQIREAIAHAEKDQRGGKIILDLKADSPGSL